MLGSAIIVFGSVEANGLSIWTRSSTDVYFTWTICVMNLPASGKLVLKEKFPPAPPADGEGMTLANLSPIGTTEIPFMPRTVSNATIASVQSQPGFQF